MKGDKKAPVKPSLY